MKKKNFLRFAAIAVSAVVLVACTVVLSACTAGEKTNFMSEGIDPQMKWFLYVDTAVNDGQGESTGSFEQESNVDMEGDGTNVQRFNPTAYINVVLEKKHIEVASEAELAVALTGEETVSDKNFEEGATFGKDIVKKFTFSDGQVATVSYGWRYDRKVVEDYGAVEAPHLEISSVVYDDYTSEAMDENQKVTLLFNAAWTAKNVTTPNSDVMTLRPWYTKSVKAGDIPGEPVWDFKLNWSLNGERQGVVDVIVTKTIPHSTAEDEVKTWTDQVVVAMGLNSNNSWYVANTEVTYDSYVTNEGKSSRISGTERAFTVEFDDNRYNFVPHYRMPGGGYLTPEPTFNTLVRSVKIVFDNGEKHKEFNIPLELKFSQSVQYLSERAKLYPDDTYLGSDVREFSFVNTDTKQEVMHHTAYTDLKLHP